MSGTNVTMLPPFEKCYVNEGSRGEGRKDNLKKNVIKM